MSTAKFDSWLNPDGTENYKCRAWVNFNGTGTVAIRASGNVSSITDVGTGDYVVNFTTAMPDANYSIEGGVQQNGFVLLFIPKLFDVGSASSVRIGSCQPNGALTDGVNVYVSIHR